MMFSPVYRPCNEAVNEPIALLTWMHATTRSRTRTHAGASDESYITFVAKTSYGPMVRPP
jgi:hypothetical protein